MKDVKDLVKVELEKQLMENGKRSWYAKDFSSIDIEARDDGSYQVVIYFQTTGIVFEKQFQSYTSKQSLKHIREMVRRACKRASNDDSSDEEFLYGFNRPHYHSTCIAYDCKIVKKDMRDIEGLREQIKATVTETAFATKRSKLNKSLQSISCSALHQPRTNLDRDWLTFIFDFDMDYIDNYRTARARDMYRAAKAEINAAFGDKYRAILNKHRMEPINVSIDWTATPSFAKNPGKLRIEASVRYEAA